MTSGNGNNGVLMILAVVILVMVGGFVAYRTNLFGGGDGNSGYGGHAGGGHGPHGGNQ